MPTLKLPEYVTMTLEPQPDEPGKMLLVIRARRHPQSEDIEVRRVIDADPGAIAFGRDLMNAMNYLHLRTR